MDYSEAVQFLYDLRQSGSKLGLEQTRRLASLAGNPQDALKFIHVAGTNGKGSVCAILESIYRAAGLKTGMYTSPHLNSFGERIQVDRQNISGDDVVALVLKYRELIARMAPDRPTFFEVVTVMALDYFQGSGCQIVIWETGLGGRLDATNIVTPEASIITNISAEHQKWLGNSISQIAFEKAGIIKTGIPVFSAAVQPDARAAISEQAAPLNAPLHFIEQPEDSDDRLANLSLQGRHQRINAMLALTVVHGLRHRFPTAPSAIKEGIQSARWQGRLQIHRFTDGTAVLLDGAHNPAGIRTLTDYVREHPEWDHSCFIVGMLGDRSIGEMLELLAERCSEIIFCNVSSERTTTATELSQAWEKIPSAPPFRVCESIDEALLKSVGRNRRVITGSLHFIGEAMEKLGIAAATPTDEKRLNDWAMR